MHKMCRASGCSVYTPCRLSGSLSPGQPKLVVTLSKIFTNGQGLKNAENSNCSSNFLSSNYCIPNLWTRTMATKATGSLRWFIEPPARSRIDCVVVFFNSFERLFFSFVLLVGIEEWLYIPAGSFPYISRVISLAVAEHPPGSILESSVLNFEFSQLLLRRMHDFQGNSVK